MTFILQILGMLDKREREAFCNTFSDLSFELEDMGWDSDPEGLVEDILFNHFGLEMENPEQLAWMTRYILEKQNAPIWQSMLHTVNLMRGA